MDPSAVSHTAAVKVITSVSAWVQILPTKKLNWREIDSKDCKYITRLLLIARPWFCKKDAQDVTILLCAVQRAGTCRSCSAVQSQTCYFFLYLFPSMKLEAECEILLRLRGWVQYAYQSYNRRSQNREFMRNKKEATSEMQHWQTGQRRSCVVALYCCHYKLQVSLKGWLIKT